MNKIVYTDEQDLRIYESLPPTDFKEFFMAYFKYNKGEKVEVTDFTNPITYALFNSYIPKLDKMEDNYNKKANANRENGKKGGRPKKQTTIEPNSDFNIDANKADLSASKPSGDNLYHQEAESGSNGLKTGKEDVKINITEKEIDEVMGTYKGTIEELNKRTITNNFSRIDSLIPKPNKEMALKQIKPYHSKEKNIGRLNDALSIFLKDVSLDDRTKYYDFILEQFFAVA